MGDLKPLREPATAESIVAKRGTTTTNGAGDGSTVVDSGLTQANDYWNDMAILILSGASKGQSRDITDFAGGTLTVSPVFANQILSGVRYFILPIKPSAAEVEDLKGTGFVKDTDSLVDISHKAGTKGTDNIYDYLGYEGATSLAAKLTLARAGFLDNIDNANLATIADISSLTATEIAYLANINNANLTTIPNISTLSVARIGYLDNINNANLATIPAISVARIGYLDNLISSETSETYSHPDGVAEQDAVVITPAELIRYGFLLLDLNNLAQNTNVKVYVKIDGTNYRCIDSAIYPTDFPTDVTSAKIELLTSSRDMKVTLQSATAEGAARNVPYYFSYKSEV